MSFGLRTKLTFSYAALFAVLLGLFGYSFFHTLAARMDSALSQELDQRAAGLRGYVRVLDGKPVLEYDPDDAEETHFIRLATRFYQVYDAQTGELLDQSPEMQLLDVDLSPEEVAQRVQDPGFDEFETANDRLRFHNSVFRPGEGHPYLLRVGASLMPVQAALRQLRLTLLWMIPAAVIVAAVLGGFMARLALRPVGELRAAAHDISISNLDRRLPVRGAGDELDLLAATFNRVFERLREAVEQMKEFTGSIAHELRTPLTALRGEAEVTLMHATTVEEYRRVLASQLEELGKLSRLVNDLLVLARAESGQLRLDRKSLDLGSFTRALAEQMEPIAEYHKIQLRTEIESEPLAVEADAQWMERVVLNLLDNAIKFTPQGGQVHISVARCGNAACLEVHDTGIGIAAEALPHVFDRFYRADPARSAEPAGVGLGLSLVRWIVEAHSGRVEAESRPNLGSTFRVRLPLARTIPPRSEAPAQH